ncbi:MAG: 1-(5-phosphoribosyl)-5-[(5-phosphoribosylamino)methylideneamino]imidazole-4-carboxamide isomerase [Planctomycetes bacterium]|nr:1-(5-phosphoribosyl)-5-[(5-phosphoribosylamino)methylideneamino]imidazole-4-carboxamide isomerase [Planctomycetota bacterium]
MYVIPAIDLRDGKCVRLIQGEYDRQITYGDNPVKQAQLFIDAGSEWVHIIDLGGAKIGHLANLESISAVAGLGKLKLEVGGGIRNEETIRQLLDLGVERIIIGTKGINDFEWLCEMSEKFSGKLALSLDTRGSKVATHGWTQETSKELIEVALEASKLPLAAIIYTDITKDGMLSGPNLERTESLVDAIDMPVIAAGGVQSVEDVKNLKAIGVEAAIIGRALYEGEIDLSEAIKASE